MKEPENFYVLFDAKNEPVWISPYKLLAEQKAAQEGLSLVVVPKGTKAYGVCLADWREQQGEGPPPSENPPPASSAGAARRFPGERAALTLPTEANQRPASDREAQARREWDASPGLQAEFFGRFELFWSYTKAVASGQYRDTPKKATGYETL